MLDRGPQPWLGEPPAEIGIKGIGSYLGERRPIEALPPLADDPARLQAFRARGFRCYTRSPVEQDEMALRACRETLERTGQCPADIDAVVIGWSEHRHYHDMQERLGTHLVRELGFHNVHVLGIGMAGCCLYAELLRAARNLIVAEGYRNVLVVETNKCASDDSDRVIPPDWYIYSDGAASCVVTTEAPAFVLRSLVHVAQSLPTFRVVGSRCAVMHRMTNSYAVLKRALRHAGAAPGEIKQYFAPNASPHLIEQHARRMRIPFSRVFLDNVPEIAHPWSADTMVNLDSYCRSKTVSPGDKFAFMAWAEGSFSAMVLERSAQAM